MVVPSASHADFQNAVNTVQIALYLLFNTACDSESYHGLFIFEDVDNRRRTESSFSKENRSLGI